MKSPMNVLRALLAVCMVVGATRSDAQLTRVREYSLHQPNDRGILFATELTRDHALLTLVAQKSGKWFFTRVRDWWEEHPDEQQIRLEAFSRRDKLDSFPVIRILPTPDGQYTVLLISAGIRGPKGNLPSDDMFIYVVRLNPFQVIASAHSNKLGIHGTLNGFLDPTGHPTVIASVYPAAESKGAEILHTYYRLAMPDLRVAATCSYSLPREINGDVAPVLENACAEFARKGGFSSAADLDRLTRGESDNSRPPFPAFYNLQLPFIKEANGNLLGMSANSEELLELNDKGDVVHRYEPGSMCGKQPVRGPAWICDCKLLGGQLTGAVIECDTSHDNLLGWSVGLKQWLAEVDVEIGRDTSKLDIPIRDAFDAKLVNIGSAKFLLVVLNGSRLEVFSVGPE